MTIFRLFVIVFCLGMHLFSKSRGMTQNINSSERVETPVVGPVYISTIYAVAEMEDGLVEMVDLIPDAYDFWGRMILTSISPTQSTFFPAPLSYPYKFPINGLQILKDKLLQISEIEHSTIKEKVFPNILPYRISFREEEKKKSLVRKNI
jgi:hypothetical protein